MSSHSTRLSIAFVLVLVAALALTGFIALAPAARADHDTLPWRNVGAVSGNLGFARFTSTTFADQQGHVFVFYNTRSGATSLTNVNVTEYATRGALDLPRFLSDGQVNTATNTVVPGRMAVAMDHAGNLYVAYVENRGAGNVLYVSTFPHGGSAWSAEVAVSTNGGNNYLPALAVSPSGTVYAAWALFWGTSENIAIASSTDAGVTFSAETNVTQFGSPSGTSGVTAAVDSGGRVYVAYDFYDRVKKNWGGNLSTSDDGTTWGPALTFSNPNSNVFNPSLLTDASGFVHLAWVDNQGGSTLIDYSRSQDRGASWSAPVQLSNPAVVSTSQRTSIAESGGTLMVAWTGASGSVAGGLSYAMSADQGDSWYPAQFYTPGFNVYQPQITTDENGTFYAAPDYAYGGVTTAPDLLVWFGPPSAPSITGIARATGQLTVSWSGSPEPNVIGYRVLRSSDGTTFGLVASVSSSTSSYVDSGLANGTYWYEVQAVNDEAILSHPSAAVSAAVGLTTQERIDQLTAEIAALQNEINTLKGTANANNQTLAQLETELTNLQNQLNTLQGQQATQTMSYANLAFEVIVVVLLVVLLLNQMRKPKSPKLMMAQPGQTEPKKPDDDL